MHFVSLVKVSRDVKSSFVLLPRLLLYIPPLRHLQNEYACHSDYEHSMTSPILYLHTGHKVFHLPALFCLTQFPAVPVAVAVPQITVLILPSITSVSDISTRLCRYSFPFLVLK